MSVEEKVRWRGATALALSVTSSESLQELESRKLYFPASFTDRVLKMN